MNYFIILQSQKRIYMQEILELINEMSPYLLLGFLFAGIMHAFVPQSIYKRLLGKKNSKSVIYAALLGIPIPLCSCGTIPTAMSLRREGASKGATISFLISTPQTGFDSIIATYSIIGLPFALLRPFASICTALLGGFLVNIFDKNTEGEDNQTSSEEQAVNKNLSFCSKIKIALHYAFVEMIQDIGKWLVIGLIVAGLITVFVPESFFALFADSPLLSMILVIILSLPMYICATGSIPIAAALMLKGLSPGTALVLLMAGPAVNLASALVVNKVMGRKTLIVYLMSIIGGAMACGLIADYLLPAEWFTESISKIKTCCNEHTSYFNLFCTIIMGALCINAFMKRHGHNHCHCNDNCSCKSHINNDAITITIKGMQCNHCKSNVKKTILAVKGVENVEIDLSTGITTITGKADVAEIRNAVEALGFECQK